MTSTPPTARHASARRGFTLVEMLLVMLLGVMVLTAAAAFAMQTLQTRRSSGIRDGVNRNGRYVGLTLSRDVQDAGVGIESTPTWGTLTVFGDTVAALSVPFENDLAAEVYRIAPPPPDTVNPLPPGGTCRTTCIEFFKEGGRYDLRPGDLARLQVNGVRRLILVTAVGSAGPNTFRLDFAPLTRLLGYPAGLADSLRLDRAGTSVQRMRFTAFWLDASTRQLMRASTIDASGGLEGSAIADDVEDFEPLLLFTGGNLASRADGLDADTTNDYNRIVALDVSATLRSEHTERTANDGQPVERRYSWRITPRNLMYERNRAN
jgi:prepilin-type N-terminal cleavage/methylation domain-containing protein